MGLGDLTTIRAEMVAVLEDPQFQRSPVMARLLTFLVDATIKGEARSLKSYTVAVDGLGHPSGAGSQSDNYARVQVTRLRKLLDSHYAALGAGRECRLKIESGSYEVSLVDTGAGSSPLRKRISDSGFQGGLPICKRLGLLSVVLSVTMTVTVILLLLANRSLWHNSDELARWRNNDFPGISVHVTGWPGKNDGSEVAQQFKELLVIDMSRFEGLRVLTDATDPHGYTVELQAHGTADGTRSIYVSIIQNAARRVIWSDQPKELPGNGDGSGSLTTYAGHLAFDVAHPTGIIHSFERRHHLDLNSPYGCWLRFSAQITGQSLLDEDPLETCAKAWFEASPDHPLAAGLYSWTLVNKSVVQFSQNRHDELLSQAISVVDNARKMNPNSSMLQLSAMRTYGFAGDAGAMRAAAQQAMAINPENRDITGIAGTFMIFQNQPGGERLVDEAIADEVNPSNWLFIGKFIAAMMRQDDAGAAQALDHLRNYDHFLATSSILAAALHAHKGELPEARRAWNQAQAAHLVLRFWPQLFFDRLPLAPPVRNRLKQWLGPVL